MEESHSVRLKILHRSRLFRESLGTVLAQRAGFVAEPVDHTSPGWLTAIESPPPDAILIDLKLPQKLAVKLIQSIRHRGIAAKVLLLVPSHDYQHLLECIELGVHGCVLGDFSLVHLVEAVERAVQGDMFCSPAILETLFHRLSRRRGKPRWLKKAIETPLPAREKEVLELIVQGLGDQQIAQRLSVPISVIKSCVRGILGRIHAEDFGKALNARTEAGGSAEGRSLSESSSEM